MANTRNILVGVDASEHSKAAFEWYMENLYRPDDHVIICHIPEVPDLPTISFRHGLAPPVEDWHKAIQGQLDKIRKLEEDYEAELLSRKVSFKIVVEQFKNPGEGIVAVAEKERALTIVVGTRGLDVVRRTLMGSVSDYVCRHSRVPVVICPNKSES